MYSKLTSDQKRSVDEWVRERQRQFIDGANEAVKRIIQFLLLSNGGGASLMATVAGTSSEVLQ